MLHSIFHPSSQPSASRPTLVMLHGRGSDEHDLFGLRENLDPRLDIYSLRAPFEFEWGGYVWFGLSEDGTVDEKSLTQSKKEILSFLDSIPSKTIILMGFSMGAIMAYDISLTEPGRYVGVLALSGFVPMQLEKDYKLGALEHLEIFISHGIDDPVIPVSYARMTKDFLSRSPAQIQYREYQMGHQINDECLADMSAWLHRVLK